MKRKLRTVLPALLAVVFLFSAGMMIRQQLEEGGQQRRLGVSGAHQQHGGDRQV